MEKLTLNYIGLDSWSRPVYQNTEGRLFVDTDNRADRQPEICTKYNNDFDGEPDTPNDLYTNYDDAMSYYNGVKNNPDCISIEVTRLEDTEDFSRFEEVEIVASYS